MYAFLGASFEYYDCTPILINGVGDHVHILVSWTVNYAIKEVVEGVKRTSSAWIRKRNIYYSQFHWQKGYGGFSVSESKKTAVRKYIAKQEAHHHHVSFEEEYLWLLKNHHVQYDERFALKD